MNNKLLLSVGMPVYNGARYLQAAFDSILSQSFENFELIVSDNGSTDATEEICQEYEASDKRIRYYRSDINLGARQNFNRVFEHARCKYFKWAAHDDLIAPSHFEKCLRYLESNPATILCYPQTMMIDENSQPTNRYPDNLDLRSPRPSERFEQFLKLYRSPHSCNPIFGILPSSTLKRTGLIRNIVSSDMILLGELSLLGEIHEIPEVLFFRRDHPNTSVRAYPEYRNRIIWFDPRLKGSRQLTHWRWLSEFLSAINTAPMALRERVLCYWAISKWVSWDLRGLTKDTIKLILWPLIRGKYAN